MAIRYYVDDDRWGNRWLFTPFWMVRCDLAKRLSATPYKQKPGIYVKGERIAARPDGGVEAVLRKVMTYGPPSRLRARPDIHEAGRANQVTCAYEREDGLIAFVDEEQHRRSLTRMPELPLYQFGNHLAPIVANYRGQPGAVVMPLRISEFAHRSAVLRLREAA